MSHRHGGDDGEAAFRAFVARSEDPLLRLALVVAADWATAQDLVQTALMQTYLRWDRLRGDEPLAYARRVVVNANIDRWRRQRGRERLTDVVPERVAQDEAASVASRDAVARALSSLTVRERRVVALRFLLDLSEVQTAAELGIPEGTVKSTAHRAITKLRANAHLHDLIGATS